MLSIPAGVLQPNDYWKSYFRRDDLRPGHFGENFTVDGLSDREVCIGDRYRIGEAEFEVTQPRVTCFRVGMRLGEPEFVTFTGGTGAGDAELLAQLLLGGERLAGGNGTAGDLVVQYQEQLPVQGHPAPTVTNAGVLRASCDRQFKTFAATHEDARQPRSDVGRLECVVRASSMRRTIWAWEGDIRSIVGGRDRRISSCWA